MGVVGTTTVQLDLCEFEVTRVAPWIDHLHLGGD